MKQTQTDSGAISDFISDRSLAAWEIVSVFSSVLICEWIGAVAVGWIRISIAVPAMLAFVLSISSHRVRRETLRDLGFRFDNFVRAGMLLIAPMIATAIICVAIGWLSGEGIDLSRWHPNRPLLVQLFFGFAWGFLQQYMLQSVINRRAQIIWGKGLVSMLIVAALFAILHLPNSWLTVATFLGGAIWAAVYQRAPNIFALAISHSITTWIMVATIPPSKLHELRIGFKYFGSN